MKKLFLNFVLLISSMHSISQVEILGGINFSNTIFEKYSDDNVEIKSSTKLYTGFHCGIMRQLRFYEENKGMYLDFGGVFNIDRSLFLLKNKQTSTNYEYVQNFINVDVPYCLVTNSNCLYYTPVFL